MIKPGWKVYASDGTEVGAVDGSGKPKYVPAESVTTVTEGRVDLSLTRTDFEGTGEFLEPATFAVIEPSDRQGIGEGIGAETRKLEGKAIHLTRSSARSRSASSAASTCGSTAR